MEENKTTDTVILTRKIQLLLDCDDQEQRSLYYQRLFAWSDMVYKGANLVLSHQYLLDHLKMVPYLNERVKIKIADAAKDADGVLCTSKMNATYRVLTSYYKGELPSAVISPLSQALFKLYRSESLAYSRGERSLRSYKRGMPIPILGSQLKLAPHEKAREFKVGLLQIPFRTFLGKDKTDKRLLLQRTMLGRIKVCSCALKIVEGKLFLLLTVEMPKKANPLQPHVIAEASLGMEHPIGVNVGKQYLHIGHKEEFLHRRLAIQAAMQRVQKAMAYNVGGRGKKRKLNSMERFKDKEKAYVDSKLHLYSRKLIDFCVKHRAGTLLLVNQQAKEEVAKEDAFLLRNWSYYGLIEKIKYKAKMAGINLIVE